MRNWHFSSWTALASHTPSEAPSLSALLRLHQKKPPGYSGENRLLVKPALATGYIVCKDSYKTALFLVLTPVRTLILGRTQTQQTQHRTLDHCHCRWSWSYTHWRYPCCWRGPGAAPQAVFSLKMRIHTFIHAFFPSATWSTLPLSSAGKLLRVCLLGSRQRESSRRGNKRRCLV